MCPFIFKLVFVFSLVSFHHLSEAQTIISGNIRGKNLPSVILFQPINGFSNNILAKPGWRVFPDQNGDFVKPVELSAPNMLVLQIGLEPVWIFVEPNDTIHVSIDLNRFTNESPNGGILFKGKNAKGNEYFNYFNYQPGRKLADFKHFMDSLRSQNNSNLNTLDNGLKIATSHFDTMLKSGDITKSFYEAVIPGIRAILLCTQFRYLLVERPKSELSEGLFMALKILEKFPIDLTHLRSSIFISSIGYWVAMIKQYEYEIQTRDSDSLISKNGQAFVINKGLKKWLFLPRDVQEILWPLNLLSLKEMFADSYSQRDVDAYLALFPDSPLKPYLRPPYFGNQTETTLSDSSEIHFIQNSTNASFIDFLKSNPIGKKLYIDFWASWCVPCKFEFKFNRELDIFLNKYNIAKLYISFDQPHLRSSMVSSVYSYNLKGYHIQVNQSMYQEVIRLFYPDGQFSIPRYMIVNEKGEILNSEALRPSDGAELFKQIKLAFGIDDD